MTETAELVELPSALPPGPAFLQGDEACAEGAIAAGCGYYAGYPITPASEIMEHLCRRFAALEGRHFMQMEDEIASIASCIGASWAGTLAMTATSGPGFSLMLENLGYAIITETPLVIVDVQRAGPSTGQATRVGQGDVMQARFGASGDYEIIALAPWSVQEMYSETIRAFSLAERFRVPVIVLADEAVGHLRESLTIEPTVHVYRRSQAAGRAPFGDAEVPPMPAFGQGEKLLVTGSTHDAWGYRRTSSAAAQATLVQRLVGKIRAHEGEIARAVAYHCDDAPLDTLFIAYGFTARSALRAVAEARQAGRRVGLLRPVTIWPFAAEAVARYTAAARRVIVAELNQGQLLREVQRIAPAASGYHRTDGEIMQPAELRELLEGGAQ
ncbi:MAG TPA: 2-oxoacid:acceptor oxidoreductase subunit alpha [Anaerolineae bacterium]|nr:2-oxoacid:acceptor oxidoreductase subunit alpha [Anaerolineae bacterium]HOR01519.1 2-oxoacid:acceptor oxidoreductase subunit alpha [Anaerolineae bacterium]HPL28101.1 2-oxoacid:acceptor oxidoreductase subunit alpha [Anaerolineae bacterium]